MFKKLDAFIDQITMYRLLVYYLIGLLLLAMALGAAGVLHYNPLYIAGSALYLFAVCWITNKVLSTILRAPANSDSTLITALILALIISPAYSNDTILFLTAAAGLAISSKYILTIHHKHIFNPAAIAVVLTAFGPEQTASWWVGNSAMMPFVVVGGVLLLRRIHRTEMVASFFGTAFGATVLYSVLAHGDVVSALHKTVFSSALFFMGFVMLTEPQTSPSAKKHRFIYSFLTGLLFSPHVHLGSIFSTPELVLCIGNVYAFVVNPRIKLFPSLVQKDKVTPDTVDFVFAPEQAFDYQPGQYMEWTLPHTHTDSRGQRRYFTLASSPTEQNLRIGVKFCEHGSSYKQAMLAMNERSAVVAASLGGDFVLPKDTARKVVLIAGGIGVTPYRSMIKYMVDTDEKRPLTLLYSAKTARDIAYMDIFETARKHLGVKVFYNLTKPGTPLPDARFRAGPITPEFLRAEAADYHDSLFYISGPHGMVTGIESALRHSGVHKRQIKTDFFSGYV